MNARLVRPDASTEAISLPVGVTAAGVIREAIGATTLAVVRVIAPGPGPGVSMWCDDDGLLAAAPVISPAARAIVAFLSRRQVVQDFAGTVLFTGGLAPGGGGDCAPLSREHDAIITDIAAQFRSRERG